jgi:dTDP-4-dehydrorhamnose 3,5-epimerase
LRKKSKTFGKYFSIVLSDKNGKSLFIPEGFAHGFLTLDKENIVYYFNTKYRSIGNEVGLNWKDKDLNIKWPIKKPILSQKDKNNMTFMEFKKKYIKKN